MIKLTSRLASSVALATILCIGSLAFAPAAYGCGGSQGGTGCRQATPLVTWLLQARVLVSVLDSLLP